MAKRFYPELGQAIFGNNIIFKYAVPKKIGDMLYELSFLLTNDVFDAGYGIDYENDVFEMHPYYWGDCTCGYEKEEWKKFRKLFEEKYKNENEKQQLELQYKEWLKTHKHSDRCRLMLSNFHYKPTGLKINWYKYIGRSMSSNKPITVKNFQKIFEHCKQSILNNKKTT